MNNECAIRIVSTDLYELAGGRRSRSAGEQQPGSGAGSSPTDIGAPVPAVAAPGAAVARVAARPAPSGHQRRRTAPRQVQLLQAASNRWPQVTLISFSPLNISIFQALLLYCTNLFCAS